MIRRYLLSALIALTAICGSTAGAASGALSSAPPMALAEGKGEYPMAPHIKALADRDGKWKIEDASDKMREGDFAPLRGSNPVLGGSGVYWLKVQIQNSTPKPYTGALEAGAPWLDSVDLYAMKPGGGYELTRSGQRVPFAQRVLAHRTHIFPLEFYPQEAKTIYIRAQAAGPLVIPLTFWRLDLLAKREMGGAFYLGAFFGILGLLIMRHTKALWAAKDADGILYLAYLAAGFFFAFCYNGLAAMWLWPGYGWAAVTPAAGLALQIAGALFTRRFLGLSRSMLGVDRAIIALIMAWTAMILLRLIPSAAPLVDQAALWSLRLFMIPLAAAALLSMMEGEASARFLLGGWALSALGALIGVSSAAGLLSYSPLGVKAGEVLFLLGAARAGGGLAHKAGAGSGDKP